MKSFKEPELPRANGLISRISRFFLLTLLSLLALPVILFYFLFRWTAITAIIQKMFMPCTIVKNRKQSGEDDANSLERRVWESPTGQRYCKDLEYQKREGFCNIPYMHTQVINTYISYSSINTSSLLQVPPRHVE